MASLAYNPDKIQVRITHDPLEIEAAQAIRYKVFYDEYGAIPSAQMKQAKRDFDKFDEIADHLIVLDNDLDNGTERIIGTYRLLRQNIAEQNGQFYTSDEYDISSLTTNNKDLLELGRSCVLPDYRSRPILQKLWEGIAHYVADHNISLMFGCASLHGTDINALSKQLAYLYHFHLAPENMRPKALRDRNQDMNLHAKEDIDARRVFSSLPPLIKGYIRLGAHIGDGAVIDKQFNTTDVCIILPAGNVKEKYVKHYERKTNKAIPAGEKISAS